MAQKRGVSSKERTEKQLAREQRREFEEELAAHYKEQVGRPRDRRRPIFIGVLVLVVVLVGGYIVLTLLPAPAQTPTAGVAVGQPAPDFTLPVYGGSGGPTVSLKALRGHPVVINFWSESCDPCRREVPLLQRTYEQYGARGTFVLLGINQADPKEDIASFGRAFKVTYPLLFDAGGTVNAAYRVTAIPTTYFIDRQGIVRAVAITELSEQSLRQGLADIGVQIP
ncbi:TlpA family protein disulfide reductase [Thermogemmatispora sp.]|jgi:peroxiredoxin|uniref:TlpA family protein disulfide reductase n=1 Tax=Thermogemmatispora sp. TaxID=1968838 RepID=UPI0035E417FD